MISFLQLSRLLLKAGVENFDKNSRIAVIVDGKITSDVSLGHLEGIKVKLQSLKLIWVYYDLFNSLMKSYNKEIKELHNYFSSHLRDSQFELFNAFWYSTIVTRRMQPLMFTFTQFSSCLTQ